MAHKKFQGDQLFTGYELLNAEYVLITNHEGVVSEIVLAENAGDDIKQYRGILSPGLINCHCHLELSHLKDVIPSHTGLVEFLCSVVTKREPSADGLNENFAEKKMQAIINAENELYKNGIVAVGDVGNTADTAEVKSKSEIRWQNFVEVIGFTDEKAEENIEHYRQVLEVYEKTQSRSISGPKSDPDPDSYRDYRDRNSLVPHAPYSISPKTFDLINQLTGKKIISIHNQEHPAEDELYKTGGGDYLKLFKIFGVDKSPFPVTGKSSIRSCLPHFNNEQTIFLVHNTYMPEEDIVFANQYANENGLKLIYCLCPNANLYIENRLPPIDLFLKHNCHLVLGTDSYSSNWQLSIAKEVGAISASQESKSAVSLSQVMQWATINGAKALQWDNELGSFMKGKKPGVVLIDNDTWTSKRLI